MDKQHSSLAFATLGVASLAVAGSCLLFIETLGQLSYLGATLAIFLAMLCATRFSALRQPSPAAASQVPRQVPKQAAKPRRETVHARAVPSREDTEDEVIESRMAALNAAVEVEDPPSTIPPPFEPSSYVAPPESASESSVVVIEESLDPALAEQFAEFRPQPTAGQDAESSVSLRQMDDIRAQIARLREESRMRHAASAARLRVPPSDASSEPVHALMLDGPSRPGAATGAEDPFARTEFSGLPGASFALPREHEDAYQRTEFSGLGAPGVQPAGFARTEYLAPTQSPR